jgi:hypothetical protein
LWTEGSHRLCLDASALVKRYVAEPGIDLVRTEMQATEGWYICRIGFVETVRAVGFTAGTAQHRQCGRSGHPLAS